MSNYHTQIQEIIEKRRIRKLVHFTRITNLKSIIDYGILPKTEIERRKIKVDYNDQARKDNWLEATSVSVTEKNLFLFPRYIERAKSKENDWIDILISTNILTEKECVFCYTNAANHNFDKFRENKLFLKNPNAFEDMFKYKVESSDYRQPIIRINQKDNKTTDNQAEICVFGIIEKKYFINLKEIEDIIEKNG